MKYISLVILSILILSCGGKKKVIETSSDGVVLQKPEKSETVVVPKPIESSEKAGSEEMELKQIKKTEIVEIPLQKDTLIPVVVPDAEPEKKVIFDHTPWDNLLQKHVTKKGKVNYEGFRKDKALLKNYLLSLSQRMPNDEWSTLDKLAYWINVYNAFTIKLIVDNYPIKSIKDIKDPWDSRFFKLGKKWYNLNEVEHKILRKMGDPRIHFGINCASFSCPPLLNKAFTSKNVNEELEQLAIRFINDTSRNVITSNPIRISKIFSWFAKDFKETGTLIDYLNQYANEKIPKGAAKKFMEYDWTLNN